MSKATLTKRLEFCSSHRYHNPKWNDAKNQEIFGPCNNPNTHGHNYLLEVTLCGEIDPVTGMIINLYDLKQYLWDVLIEFDHKNLNLDTPYFTDRIPTTENLALTLWNLLEQHPKLPDLDRIQLYEDETLYAEVTRTSPSTTQNLASTPRTDITRRYSFSAAKNLPTGQISGHNYTMGITVSGPIHEETGQIINLEQLDRLVQTKVLDRFCNNNISLDPDLTGLPTTKEHLARYLWQTLHGNIPQGNLSQVTVAETHRSSATYRG